MKLVQIAAGSRNWYHPMHIISIEVSWDNPDVTMVELVSGRKLITHESPETLRRRVDGALYD